MSGHLGVELAGDSTIGRDHRLKPANGQDALHILRAAECTVGLVADGCGSSKHSEVGSKLAVRILSKLIAEEVRQRGLERFRWWKVKQGLLSRLDMLAESMDDDYKANVHDYFLFTLVGVLLTDDRAGFFALGDGLMIINDELKTLGPFANNEPPYLGYALLPNNSSVAQDAIEFQVVASLPLGELDCFMIGTDGVKDLMAVRGRKLPGMDEQVGPISQFWEDRYYGRNPQLLRRRLNLIARDYPRKNPQAGLLPDDTTVIFGRNPGYGAALEADEAQLETVPVAETPE